MKGPIKNFLRVILVLLFVGLSIVPASAQDSSGLSIDPRKDYVLSPGESTSDKLPVSNLNDQLSLTLSLRVVDFTYLNNSGTPKLLLSQNTPNTTWSLKPFINLPRTVTIQPGQTSEVPISVSVPKSQGAGSYYSAIEYSSTGSSNGNVNLNASGISLVFLTVTGKAKESMSLRNLGAYEPNNTNNGGKYIKVATTAPSEVAYTLTNKGNLTESPVGSVVLQPMFGVNNINISNANSSSSLALIGQSRLFTACIQTETETVKINGVESTSKVCNPHPHLSIGKYTIKLDVFYGQSGKTTNEVTSVAHFWYIPWWFIVFVVAAVIVIIGAISWLFIKIRKLIRGATFKST